MGPRWPIWQEALYIVSSSLTLPSVSRWPQSPSSAHFASCSSVSPGTWSGTDFLNSAEFWNAPDKAIIFHQLSPQMLCSSRWQIWRSASQNAPWYPQISSQVSARRNKQKHNSSCRDDYLPRDSGFRIMQNIEQVQSKSSHNSDLSEEAMSIISSNKLKFP